MGVVKPKYTCCRGIEERDDSYKFYRFGNSLKIHARATNLFWKKFAGNWGEKEVAGCGCWFLVIVQKSVNTTH